VERLTTFGWDDGWADAFAAVAPDGAMPGRVVQGGQDRVLVATEEGDDFAGASELPVVGDWVALTAGVDDDPRFQVAAVLPRRSTLVRHRSRGVARPHVLAANADVVFVVAGLDKPLNPERIDRELVTAWQSGAEPIVVVTKADLLDPALDLEEVVAGLQLRVGARHRIVVTSSTDGRGIEELRRELSTPELPHATAVLFGPSGAGKSTLANRLIGEDVLATGAVRERDLKGRHTTTNRHLKSVPGGGVLLDTPGLRSMGLWEVDDGLFLAFRDLEDLAADCRFSSCTHSSEPGCVIRAAVEAGDVDPDRVANWQKLNDEFDALVSPEAQAARRPGRPRR
jgi:ribosome biogenesis GTPase